jgi:hypothetical protein
MTDPSDRLLEAIAAREARAEAAKALPFSFDWPRRNLLDAYGLPREQEVSSRD